MQARLQNKGVRQARRPVSLRLHQWSLGRLGYGNSDPATNGEFALLDDLSDAPVVFDVGARHGDYAAFVLDRRPNADVHCFEPSRESFAEVSRRLAGQACLHNVALSDNVGTDVLYSDQSGSAMSSLYRRELGWLNVDFSVTEDVAVSTLDAVCAEEEVERIDLLKLDAEGAEALVLSGAKRMLGEERIDRVVFEYGGTALDSHFFIRDFYRLLPNFDLYRVLPDGLLPLGAYSEHLELAHYSNYCAVRRSSVDTASG
jgi:FkbM family methyltransferase